MGYPKDFFVRTQAEKKDQATIRDLEARQARGSILGPKQKDTLADARKRNRKASRRVFLGRSVAALAGVGSAAALTAVGIDAFGNTDKDNSGSDTATPPKTPEAPADLDKDGKKILLREIDNLPKSSIKDLYVARIVPLFSQPTPSTARAGDFEFPVYDASVTVNYPLGLNKPDGKYRGRRDDELPIRYTTLEGVNAFIPIVESVIRAEDKGKFSKGPDGSLGIMFDIPSNAQIVDGTTPEIVVNRVYPSNIKPEFKDYADAFERFLFIKEAGGCLLDNLLAEYVFNKLQAFGLPTHVNVRAKDGSARSAEFIYGAIKTVQNNRGRSLVAEDVGAAILGYKALQGSPQLDLIRQADPVNRNFIDFVSKVDLGTSPEEILTRTYQFALNYPRYSEIKPFTIGNIELSP